MFHRFSRAGVGAVFSNLFAATILLATAGLPAFAAEDDLEFIVSGYATLEKHNIGVTSEPVENIAARIEESFDPKTITSSAALKAGLKKFYNDNPLVAHNMWGRKDAMVSVENIQIFKLLDQSVILKVKYRWIVRQFQKTGLDFLIFYVEIIPTYSNFQYDEELFVDAGDSHYPDIATYIASLGLPPESLGGDDGCQYDQYEPNPCPGTREQWQAFAEREGLALNRESAAIFRAYVNRRYGQADRVYARVKGYKIPTYSGYGEELDAMRAELRKLRSYRGGENCDFNHYSPTPCPGVLQLWLEFAQRHDLALDPLSAGIFEAFAEQDFKRGDRLYAVAKGLPIPGYRGPGESVLAMRQELFQIQSHRSSNGGCVFNHYDPNPCPGTILLWRDFAEKNHFELNLASADIFQAYANGNYRRGDRRYARAKGVTVDQLVHPDREPPPPMIIDILPSTRDTSMIPVS